MNVSDLPQPGFRRRPSAGSFSTFRAFRGLRRRLLIATLGSLVGLASSLNAAWTYAGGTLNAAQTYDGLGADSAINPRSQGATGDSDYIGVGGVGSIAVTSGSLTILANDFKVGRNTTNSVGTVTVASGASLTINQTNQWGGGIGVAGNNTNSITGTVTVRGSLTWFLSGSSEQTFVVGNGGVNTFGTINLDGGTMVVELDAAQAINASAGMRVGSGGAGNAAINLNGGLLQIKGNLPFGLGGQWNTVTTTPAFQENGNGVITVNNGSMELLGSNLFAIGTAGDYINFIAGGAGHFSIFGWDNLSDPGYGKFKALIDAGKVRLNGTAVTPGDYSGFVFSTSGSQGVLSAVNNLAAPTFIQQPLAASKFVGESFTFITSVAGNPTPSLQWQKSTDGGANWLAVPGATSADLSFGSLAYTDKGLFRLVASNSQGAVNSNEVALAVTYPAPVITTAPISRTVLAGSDVTLVVAATGRGTLTYQWQKNGSDLSGQTGASLSLPAVTAGSAASYTVIVTDHAAEADALPATTTAVTAVVGVLDVPVPQHAISLNFVGAAPTGNAFGGASDLGVLAPADTAGILPVANWNNSSAATGVAVQTTPLVLVDNAGAATPVSATWSSANTWAVLATDGAASAKSTAGRLLHGYIERRATVAPGNVSVSLAQIPYGTYDVYVYLTAGTTGAVGKVTANGNDAGSLYYRAPGATLGLDPAYVQGTAVDLASAQAQVHNANFVRFAGLAGPSLTVAVADAVSGSGTGGVAGISIVDTTPAGSAYPPLVASAPAGLLKRGGSSASFSVSASSVNPGGVITYQWSKNGSPISGATSATLNLGTVHGADSGTYSVLVTDTSTATGSPTTASLQAPLVVVDGSRPALLNVDIGTATTSALGSGLMLGDGILRTTGIPSSGANTGIGLNTGGPGTDIWTGLTGVAGSATYSGLKESSGLGLAGVSVTVAGVGGVLDNITAGTLGSAANGSGPLLRDLVFTDNQTTPITCTLSGLGDFAGKKITLVVYAVGTRSTLFGENTANDAATVSLSGDNNYLGTAPRLTSNVEGRDLAYNTEAYAAFEGIVSPAGTVVWTLGPDTDAGSIPLNGFQLLLTDADLGLAPTVNTQPVSAIRLAGLSQTFTAGVTASPAPALKWQKSADGVNGWADISGATNASYTIASVTASDTAFYRLVATNSAGTTNSSIVALDVQTFAPSASRAIGLNFRRNTTNTTPALPVSTLDPTDLAGVVSLPNWDNRGLANSITAVANLANLIDSTGDATPVAVALSAGTGSWYSSATTGTHPMQKLFHGYWDPAPGSLAAGTTGTLTVSGVTYTSYDVYVYFAADSTTAYPTAQISVNGGAAVYGKAMGVFGLPAGVAGVPPYMAQATASSAETATVANYVKVSALTGSGFTVTTTKVDANYGIVGIQIVNTGLAAPAAVSGLAAATGDTQASLTWSAVSGATGYNVYRSATAGGPYTRVATGVTSVAHVDTGLVNGTTYRYVVKAVNAGGASAAYSNEASVTPGAWLSARDAWRQTYFATTANSGPAADTADPDGDGLVNFLEYAFGENPTAANHGPSVVVARSGDLLAVTFVHIDDPTLSYIVEATNDLAGVWTPRQTYTGFTTAGTTTHTDDQSLAATPRRFLRVRVSAP